MGSHMREKSSSGLHRTRPRSKPRSGLRGAKEARRSCAQHRAGGKSRGEAQAAVEELGVLGQRSSPPPECEVGRDHSGVRER
jgi:hypothetical protein